MSSQRVGPPVRRFLLPLRLPSLLALVGLAACDATADPVAPALEPGKAPAAVAADAGPDQTGGRGFTVMTRNLYIGGDTGPLLGLDFGNLPAVLAAVAGFWSDVQATRFPERAAALADEIDEARPHVVGLQEAVRFVLLDGGFRPVGALDFLAVLEAELAARGLAYRTVAVQENTSAALPLSVDPLLGVDRWLSFTDRVALLVRDDVELTGPARGDNYAATFAAGPVELKRGWIHARAVHRDVVYDVMTTHLETQALAPVQALQVQELLGVMAGLDGVVVLAGDLNSDAAAGPGAPSWTPTWGTLVEAGFLDAWEQASPGLESGGTTCCHAKDLANPLADLAERIDFVLVRPPPGPGNAERVAGSVAVERVGEEPHDRTAGGLWPSDHVGLVAHLRLAPGLFADR